jgi:hypothetical protein
MALSQRTLDTLVDLVEIKLSCLEIYDREDSRELQNLERCRDELLNMTKKLDSSPAEVVAINTKKSQRKQASG